MASVNARHLLHPRANELRFWPGFSLVFREKYKVMDEKLVYHKLWLTYPLNMYFFA